MENHPRHDNLVHVETPENVRLTFRVAGPALRLGAYFIDLALRVGIFAAVLFLSSALLPFDGLKSLSIGVILLGHFVLEWGYGTFFEAFRNGQTPGKKAAGLRVVKVGGYPIGFLDALLRNLLRAADGMPLLASPAFLPSYGLGFLALTTNSKMQRLGDLLAGTLVVQDRPLALRKPMLLPEELRPLPAARLRSGTRPPERTLDLIARLRTEHGRVPRARREEIAQILAVPLAARLGYEPDENPDGKSPDSPETFLLRVLKTFQAPHPEETEDAP